MIIEKEIKLTNREKQVLELIVKGLNNRQIAKELNFSIHTAKAFVCILLHKFNVKNRVEAAVFATKHKLVS